MTKARCPKCDGVIETLDEVSHTTQGAGEVVLVCCPSCHAALGAVKARTVERAFQDAGQKAADFLGRLSEKIQTR
jgi:hypothetical protein